MFNRVTCALAILQIALAGAAQSEPNRTIEHVEIDGVKIPFGTTIEIAGPCVEKDSFEIGFSAASLRVLRINGKPTLENIEVHLFAGGKEPDALRDRLHAMNEQAYYKVTGRLVDARCGALESECALSVERFEPIENAPLKLSEFIDRKTRLEGIAISEGKFRLHEETAVLEGIAAWPAATEGKKISVRGIVRRGADGLRVSGATWRLVELADQVGQDVALEGALRSMNGDWWFNYRGADIYLTSEAGPTQVFPSADHWRPVRASGRLVRQDRPSPDQMFQTKDRGFVPAFVVRDAKIEYLDNGQTWQQRFATIHRTFHAVRDGVPELLAEEGFRRNLLGNETSAMLFWERNSEIIRGIVQDATPKSLDVVATRMHDSTLHPSVRLLYASILAAKNDQRGRDFLLRAAQPKEQNIDLEAIYCLGLFATLASPMDGAKTETAWAEPQMLALIGNRKQAVVDGKPLVSQFDFPDPQPISVADAALQYSDIATVSAVAEAGHKALFDYVMAGGRERDAVTYVLCNSDSPLSVDALLSLESIAKDSGTRRTILSKILMAEHPRGVDRFFGDLKDGFVYMDIRDRSSPEVICSVRPAVAKLRGEAQNHARLLLLFSEKDPVPALLALLADPKWTARNMVLYELARLGDPRAVPVVGRILREAPKDYFASDVEPHPSSAVQNGLNAITRTGTTEAIQVLIELLNVDLSRFGGYDDRLGYQRMVAAHLIELTGESFGVDSGAWRKWQQAHPAHSVPAELANPNGIFRLGADSRVDLGR